MAVGIRNIGTEDDVLEKLGWIISLLISLSCNLVVDFLEESLTRATARTVKDQYPLH